MRPVGRLAVGALFAVAALTVGDLSAGEKGKGKVKVGDPAPAFQAVDAQGKPWKSGRSRRQKRRRPLVLPRRPDRRLNPRGLRLP